VADFALFDLFNPLLSLIDDVLSNSLALAPVWRIAIFAALGSVASMSLFNRLSNQAELAVLKQRIRAVQKELARPGMEPGDLKKNIQQNLKLTTRQLRLSLWPALVASIPVVFLLAFCSNQFSVTTSKSDFRVYVTPKEIQGSPLDFEWLGVNAQWDARKKAWTFYQLNPGQTASLMLGSQKQLSLPTSVPTSVIHKKRWWNYLFANPAGYLDANVNIGLFAFNTPAQVIFNWGPGWMRGWLFAFMLFLVLFSVVIKVVWKIH
jgi:uncharacterized membrane protein (DUF106 family)